jgi:hypothetical protein
VFQAERQFGGILSVIAMFRQLSLASAGCAVWNTAEMTVQPEELPLHLSRIETSQGTWLIAVYSVAEVEGGDTLLLNLTLEQSIDSEHFRSRELGMKVPAAMLRDPDMFGKVVDRIRHWIETTQGDGLLELGQ